MAHDEDILAASAKHPTVTLPKGQTYKYGTAGFRMRADHLEGVAFRVGLVASLRSRKLDSQAIGVMITASHNPAVDNGLKIIDPMGEMLEEEWESYATSMVNATSHDEVVAKYNTIAEELKINLSIPAKVIYARDTRPSGHTLAAALAAALTATDTKYVDHKILTTPQLHYLVRATNTENTPHVYGEVSEAGYYKKFSAAFAAALKGKKIKGRLMVDCANGVGGPKLAQFLKYVPKEANFDVKIINDNVLDPALLNLDSGADFVKTRQRVPPSPHIEPGLRSCSFDGDADRLIYYWIDPEGGFALLDGDRISSLVASFISELLERADLKGDVRVGVVQTAYANGASTNYISQHLKLEVMCTPTGVKYLHTVAHSFDIGVYFEANGHGTVLFSPYSLEAIKSKDPQSPAQREALDVLASLGDLVNQTVGDALSDMLLVEVILAHRGWTLRDWYMTYTDLPNRLVRVEVLDKDMFRTTDAERRLTHPPGAQEEIDIAVGKYQNARAFARASGTENACRVYAEAASRAEAHELGERVARIIERYGSGH